MYSRKTAGADSAAHFCQGPGDGVLSWEGDRTRRPRVHCTSTLHRSMKTALNQFLLSPNLITLYFVQAQVAGHVN